jgi:nucleoside-diphosphate-sugar epimerase
VSVAIITGSAGLIGSEGIAFFIQQGLEVVGIGNDMRRVFLDWKINPNHTYNSGIRKYLSIAQTLHSLFDSSKVAADVLVQEYGRYFGLLTACFPVRYLTGLNPRGGGGYSNCLMSEAINLCREIGRHDFKWTYPKHNGIGDHTG